MKALMVLLVILVLGAQTAWAEPIRTGIRRGTLEIGGIASTQIPQTRIPRTMLGFRGGVFMTHHSELSLEIQDNLEHDSQYRGGLCMLQYTYHFHTKEHPQRTVPYLGMGIGILSLRDEQLLTDLYGAAEVVVGAKHFITKKTAVTAEAHLVTSEQGYLITSAGVSHFF